jgi:lipoprotein-anchoring transpeptidase ErfK/SrfK
LLQDEGDRDSAGDVLYQLFTEYPEAPEIQEAVYRLKDLWKPWLDSRSKDEELIKFNKVLSWLVERAVDETILQECYELLGRINARVFRGSRPIEGLLAFHTVQYGENLSSIAKKYGVAPARIAQINGLRSWNAIRAKQTLRVIKGRIRMVVDKNRFNMDVFIEGHFFKRYGVGIGRGGNTPTAITSVSRSMARNPSYTVPETGELISPDSPKNPIGTRWIGLDIGRGFGIHGTIEPESIGKESSNGCIRLKNEDVEELYDYVMVGDEVQIR